MILFQRELISIRHSIHFNLDAAESQNGIGLRWQKLPI